MRRILSVLMLALIAVGQGLAREAGGPDGAAERAAASLPPYQPRRSVSGTIRLWGHGSPKTDFMGRLSKAWESGFTRYQPGVRFDNRMYGTASAMGALYTGAGDLSILGEEIFPFERTSYEHAMGYPPQQVEVANGSLDVRNFEFAQMFFVNADNPIGQMTLEQLDAIFGTEHLRGAPKNFRTWGDLGLGGEWASRPIHLYGWAFDNDFWIYLQHAVFGGSHRFNGNLKGYSHIYRADGTIYDAGLQALEALAKDPDGIAISNVRYLISGVKPLALAGHDGGPYVAATKETLISRSYPLWDAIPAVFNCGPGHPLDPVVEEFLRYLLSRDGQEAIARDGEYLPLSPETAAEQMEKLEGLVRARGQGPGEAVAADRGVLRIWGDDQMSAVLSRWELGFESAHPGARFENTLIGTDTGMAGLYTGTADLAVLGREINAVESMAFAWVNRHPPMDVEVATGSLGRTGGSTALAVLLNRDNPLAHITLAQLDAILGAERLRGLGPIRTWGDLGLFGDWAAEPIHVYGPDVDSDDGVFVRQAVLKGSRVWNWEALTEFRDRTASDGSADPASHQILEALAADRFGIGITELPSDDLRVKAAEIAAGAGGPFCGPTADNLISGRYPLARKVHAYLDRPPGKPVDPRLREFLRYILSPEGQALLKGSDGYLPLSAKEAADVRAAVGESTGG